MLDQLWGYYSPQGNTLATFAGSSRCIVGRGFERCPRILSLPVGRGRRTGLGIMAGRQTPFPRSTPFFLPCDRSMFSTEHQLGVKEGTGNAGRDGDQFRLSMEHFDLTST